MEWIVGIGIGLALLFNYPKQMAAVLLVLAIGAGGFFGFVYFQDQRRAERHREAQESVSMAASFDADRCSPEFPILVKISNSNAENLLSLSFSLVAFREGYSASVYEEPYQTSDKIIPPGKTYSVCWSVPRLDAATPPQSLIWKVRPISPTFGTPP